MRATVHMRCRGFTLFELMLAVALLAVATLTVSSTYGSASRVANDSQVRLRASRENRRSLAAIAHVLRGADVDTLVGFDAAGKTSSLTFSRVEGASLTSRSHAPTELVHWQPETTVAGGIQVGNVVLSTTGGDGLLAEHVPEGGFRVSRSGATLVIEVTTAYPQAGIERLEVRGRTAITLRN